MSARIGVVDYVVIGIMFLVSFAIGIYFRFTGGRQKTKEEFLMGGRNMSIFPVVFSLMASLISAVSLLGSPAETYMYGAQNMMLVLGFPLGCFLAAYGILPVYYGMKITTVYSYLEERFGKVTRTVCSLLFILQMLFYMSAVLYAPAVAINAVSGISVWLSIVVLITICTLYCILGGLKAVLWTDVFQSVLMYFTVVSVMFQIAKEIGGANKVLEVARIGERLQLFNTSFDLTERYTLWNSSLSGMVLIVSMLCSNQVLVQRLLSIADLKKSQKAVLFSSPISAILVVLSFLLGAYIYSYFQACDPLQNPASNLKSPDQLVPYTILTLFGNVPGLPGLCIAGIFSASLSTISSCLHSIASVTMEDFIAPFCYCQGLTEARATFVAKAVAIIYASFCLCFTYIVANFRGILEATVVLIGMVGSPTLGLYFLGMFTIKANEPGSLIGLFSGFLIHAWLGFGSYAAKIKIPTLPRSTEGCPSNINDTLRISANYTFTDTGFQNVTNMLSTSHDKDRYILPVYKISYLWFNPFSFLVVIIVGYIASSLIAIWKEYPSKNPSYYSPFVRSWYFKNSKTTSEDGRLKNIGAVELKPFLKNDT